jgi:hypothetical protein
MGRLRRFASQFDQSKLATPPTAERRSDATIDLGGTDRTTPANTSTMSPAPPDRADDDPLSEAIKRLDTEAERKLQAQRDSASSRAIPHARDPELVALCASFARRMPPAMAIPFLESHTVSNPEPPRRLSGGPRLPPGNRIDQVQAASGWVILNLRKVYPRYTYQERHLRRGLRVRAASDHEHWLAARAHGQREVVRWLMTAEVGAASVDPIDTSHVPPMLGSILDGNKCATILRARREGYKDYDAPPIILTPGNPGVQPSHPDQLGKLLEEITTRMATLVRLQRQSSVGGR